MDRKIFAYKPPIRERINSLSLLSRRGDYLYKEQLNSLNGQPKKDKIAGLTELLGFHHPDSLVHTFENTLLTVILAQGVLDIANRNNLPMIMKAFEGALVHDIGKTGVDQELLNTENRSSLSPQQRESIRLHGALGGYMLKKIGLGDLAYFSYEHNLGSGKRETWEYRDLRRRHKLTEIVALADLIGGLLDPRRPYHNPVEKEYLFWIIKTKGEQGIYTEKLMKAFMERVAAKDMYPPFNKEDYEKNQLFMTLIRAYGITDIFEKTISEDQLTRNAPSTRIEKS